jgi:hypothetical protein
MIFMYLNFQILRVIKVKLEEYFCKNIYKREDKYELKQKKTSIIIDVFTF